jgi:hypothetical protein
MARCFRGALGSIRTLFLVLQSLISFGCGGYLTGRTSAAVTSLGHDELERLYFKDTKH